MRAVVFGVHAARPHAAAGCGNKLLEAVGCGVGTGVQTGLKT